MPYAGEEGVIAFTPDCLSSQPHPPFAHKATSGLACSSPNSAETAPRISHLRGATQPLGAPRPAHLPGVPSPLSPPRARPRAA